MPTRRVRVNGEWGGAVYDLLQTLNYPRCVTSQSRGSIGLNCKPRERTVGNNRVELTNLESAAIDSMITMRCRSTRETGDGETELIATPDGVYVLKLSSWITRHIAAFNTAPSVELANTSAHVITGLMKKLGCPHFFIFPTGQTENLKRLDAAFGLTEGTPAPGCR